MNQLSRKIFKLNHLLCNGRTSTILNTTKVPLFKLQSKSLILSTASIFYEKKPLAISYKSSSNPLFFSTGLTNNQRSRISENQFKNNASIDEDFEGAEPTESDGHELNFKSKTLKSGFASFDIPEQLLSRLNELNYKQPFEIQEATLKDCLDGKDLVGKAFTGSGKTLAFAIPIISKILKMENKSSLYPKCLILAPTRELCLQLTKTIQELAPYLRCLAVYGGANMMQQTEALRNGVDIVCATPGRLRDLTERRNFVTDEIELICLDEADELLTPNFLSQIRNVIELTNKKQMLMFSATISKGVFEIVKRYMTDPVLIDLTQGQKYKLPTNIEHYLLRVPYNLNITAIKYYLEHFQSERCIVFTKTKREAKMFCEQLQNFNIRAQDIHSDITQNSRQRILEQFRSGKLNVLVATDVAARGIDIPEVNLVIQIGEPANGVEYYIHRSGRTGRGGRPGKSILIDNERRDNGEVPRDLSRIVKFKILDPSNLKEMSFSKTRISNNHDNEFSNKDKYIQNPTNRQKFTNNRSFDSRSRSNFKSFDDSDDEFRRPRYTRDSNNTRRYQSNRDDDF